MTVPASVELPQHTRIAGFDASMSEIALDLVVIVQLEPMPIN